ncbi:SBBP repeat-containing protein [Oscillatoria sp. FACHB-1407]|uniref:SBBP repeat-containing protein n=1 Tax=Oscillatoria sp. FACHB-1407 TaxID=2692847 RepID=UPI0018EF9806|nr:SBBP repeat-containing protein [Oscillatoria sp. FACHB-1407]
MEDQPLLQVYTPNSDFAAGFYSGQIIWGRTGNDTLRGFQPSQTTSGEPQIDLFIGDVAIDDPLFRQWNDTFVLGDFTRGYYNNGTSTNFGLNDFGFIADFNPQLDSIELYGSANNYQILDLGIGSAILQQTQAGADVVSFLLGNTNLSLNESYFAFQGTTPPPGPGVPQAQQQGTSNFDIAATTATDSNGNVYIAGGTDDDDANNSRDAVISKYDSDGNLIWTQQFGTSQFETISGIETDAEGNFYVAGITGGDLARDKQAIDSEAFVAKYDSEGNQLWIQQFGQNSIFQTFGIDVDAEGNAYLTGIDVKPSETDIATDDFWVAKFDTDGNQVFFTETGSVDDAFDESYDVTVSNDGSVYTTGWTLGDLAGPNAGAYDTYISKFDNNGELEWIRQFGTSDYEWGWGVDTDSQGNVYTTGWTLGSLVEEGNAGSYDVFLTKYDSLGNQIWVRQFGTSGDDEGFDLFIDDSDNIFLTGYTTGGFVGGNAGSFDPWVAKYDIDGNQIWLQQFGTSAFDQAYAVTANGDDVYVTGITQGSLGGVNTGAVDTWSAKLDASTGALVDFGGSSLAANSSSGTALSVSNTNSNSQPITDQATIDFIKNFFKTFTTETLGLPENSGGPTGAGLEVLLRDPYGRPEPVPEPSMGIGLMAIATVTWISKRLRASSK